MFLLLGLTVMLALNMESMPEPDQELTENLHRSLGVLIMLLLMLRFGWKLANPQPADLPGPVWMNIAAHGMHWLLYLVVLVQAVAGIAMSQADGEPVSLFGLFTLPVMIAADPQAEEFWEEIHEVNWIILTVLIIGHVLAALYRHFGEKGEVFRRMGVGPP
jgi:cytochrome b561